MRNSHIPKKQQQQQQQPHRINKNKKPQPKLRPEHTDTRRSQAKRSEKKTNENDHG